MRTTCIAPSLYNLTIKIERSIYYIRLSVLLHVGFFVLLCVSHFGSLCCLAIITPLFLNLKQIFRDQKPHPTLRAIQLLDQAWLLINHDGEFDVYTNLSICFESQWVYLLCFSSRRRRRYCLLFQDQLDQANLKKILVFVHTTKSKTAR